MQFGRIDNNAYTLDFQYPFTAVQAFGVALANVTQRLKWMTSQWPEIFMNYRTLPINFRVVGNLSISMKFMPFHKYFPSLGVHWSFVASRTSPFMFFTTVALFVSVRYTWNKIRNAIINGDFYSYQRPLFIRIFHHFVRVVDHWTHFQTRRLHSSLFTFQPQHRFEVKLRFPESIRELK